jgi:(R,R)-butanediol dehydrogenase/meso-butanediol dehydrogenase/diacetyl reductase
VLGYCTVTDSFVPAHAVNKQLQMHFSLCYGVPDFQFVVQVLATGALEPRAMITDVIPLECLPEAFEALRVPSDQCKVLVDPQA